VGWQKHLRLSSIPVSQPPIAFEVKLSHPLVLRRHCKETMTLFGINLRRLSGHEVGWTVN